MTRIALTAAAALIALAAAMPAQAVGPWFSQNGVEMNGLALNGIGLNGRNMQGRNMQGVSLNGAQGHEATGGVSLLSIELAR